MISYTQAQDIVAKNNPNKKVKSAIEQDELFVFEFEADSKNRVFDVDLYNLAAVNKSTGEYIDSYDPLSE